MKREAVWWGHQYDEDGRSGEIRTVSSTDTRATVLDGPVRNGELAKVVADHLGLDLDGVEDLLNQIPYQVNPHVHRSKPPYNAIKPFNQHQQPSRSQKHKARKKGEKERTFPL